VEISSRRVRDHVLRGDDGLTIWKEFRLETHSEFRSKGIGQYIIALLSRFLMYICEYIYILNKAIIIPTQC
jgi:hypothetical protein